MIGDESVMAAVVAFTSLYHKPCDRCGATDRGCEESRNATAGALGGCTESNVKQKKYQNNYETTTTYVYIVAAAKETETETAGKWKWKGKKNPPK